MDEKSVTMLCGCCLGVGEEVILSRDGTTTTRAYGGCFARRGFTNAHEGTARKEKGNIMPCRTDVVFMAVVYCCVCVCYGTAYRSID